MNLTIDIGNTCTKLCLFSGSKLLEELPPVPRLTATLVRQTLRKHPVRRAIACIVGPRPAAMDALRRSVPTLLFDGSTPIPIANRYATPQPLGPDRLAVAVAAHAMFPHRNVLAIDSGTAITYELVSARGEYLGGAISPGLGLRFRALNLHTAKLPLLTPSDVDGPLVGNSTQACIATGVQRGLLAEIDSYIDAVAQCYPQLKVLITGGDANFLVDRLKNRIFADPNLLAKGLNEVLEYNESKLVGFM
ncbi:MAG: type III pantothenate kinase [Bacteroidales bacterium]|nr:type III pantothenate kinase [Bacteroidales bacterium]